jgi:HSP20 family molecular chaperone IbpA
MTMSEDDNFSAIFEEMMRLAESLIGGQTVRQTTRAAPQPQDEMIEGRDRLTYILNAPGYEKDDLRVSVQEDELEVKGPDFIVKKKFPGRVEPDTAKSSYVNGVLSVIVERRR